MILLSNLNSILNMGDKGFIVSHLRELLLDKKHRVIDFDNCKNKKRIYR